MFLARIWLQKSDQLILRQRSTAVPLAAFVGPSEPCVDSVGELTAPRDVDAPPIADAVARPPFGRRGRPRCLDAAAAALTCIDMAPTAASTLADVSLARTATSALRLRLRTG